MAAQKSVKNRECFFCKSIEDEPRPIGNYKVELKEIHFEDKKVLACQSCYLNKKRELNTINKKESIMKKSLIERLKNIFFLIGVVMVFSMVELQAQGLPGPPGFPDNPSEAPIDGGLGLLAAAGGAYAYKKLRKKKNEEDLE
ncbi:MAG: hypothetical protein ABJK11_01305 [Balneola sp.]